MKIIIYITISLFFLKSTAQKIDYNSPLPISKRTKKGVLPNGLTYYLHQTDVTKDAASYYIIQNVGSVLENDDQQGLAHFLEHMAFNGTKNFEGKSILNTLQKHGAIFGKDINAYTSFDETVYNLNNIPTTDNLIDTCLLILHDWSNYLLLTEKEIDDERGVIKEEWRTRQTGRMRILQQSLSTKYNNSKYAKRLPIGQMRIVENFKYKTLRDFYHDWYRTDLQAIAIIGDINVEDVEQRIKKLFASIPAVENPKKREIVHIPDNKELLYTIAMDKEVTTSSISFDIRHPKPIKSQTVSDLKTQLLNTMVTRMLSSRLKEISQKPEASFLNAQIWYGKHSRSTNTFSTLLFPKTNKQKEALTSVFNEINRAVKFGFTQEEIDRTITKYKNSYQNKIQKQQDIPHGSIIQTIKDNYLNHSTITDLELEYDLAQDIFKTLNLNEFHKALMALYTDKNRTINITGVEGHDNLLKKDVVNILKQAENSTSLLPYKDAFSGKTLLSDYTPVQGQIVSEKPTKAINATTFIMSNGVKVHYKFADKNKNDVSLNAISYGGLSLVEDKDLPSANMVSNVVGFSGLGDYSPSDLEKILAGKTASTRITISEVTESINGSSVTKDIETLLQMVHLRFVKPRFDPDAYKVLMGNVNNYIIRRSKDINEKIKDSITIALYGNNNPKHRLFNTSFSKDISLESVESVYLERFKNAADFDFFIVGDIQKETLKPLLEKYIGSIPTNLLKEQWKNNSEPWIHTTIDKDVYLKMEDPKSSVRISYKNNYAYNLKNRLIARTLGDILQLRYTETLREQEGGTYGARARATVSKRPIEQATISVSFDCNPDKAEQLVAIVHQEIQKIADGDIQQLDLDKTLTSYIKERKQQQDHNRYEMRLLQNFFREGYNMNDPENFENLIKAISIRDIKLFASELLQNAKTYEIVIKPSM